MAITQLHQQRLQDQTNAQSMARQALINSNFDVCQRTTSVATPDVTVTYAVDRFWDYPSKDGGTLPTLTRSRQLLTPGEISNAFYYSRLATNGSGTSLGVNSVHNYTQRIENGTRLLCGLNKTVTISFWARSDISNKRICPTIWQYYGTGGSPTAIEIIKGEPITLTSSWTKYTATFTTNTLVGKTFGTNNDDYLQFNISYVWGTTWGNTYIKTGVTAETYVGSGNIDIAQVQLCAGDEVLPFQPKSYGQELADCQRYCFQITNTGGTADPWGTGAELSTTQATINMYLPVTMRVRPTVDFSYSGLAVGHPGTGRVNMTSASIDTSSPTCVGILCTVAGGLTTGFGCNGVFQNGSTNYIRLEAEL